VTGDNGHRKDDEVGAHRLLCTIMQPTVPGVRILRSS
jgi:hypothetical protein